MKKFIAVLCALLLPLSVAAADAAPTSRVISHFRMWAKPGHQAALEKAIVEHAAKFHTGKWKWNVNEILTGPDGGAFHLFEGSNTWTAIEGRGNLGPQHDKHFQATILPHVERTSPESYHFMVEDLSINTSGPWPAKSIVTHFRPKPGHMGNLRALMAKYRKAWEKLGDRIAVWQSSASGPLELVLVRGLKNGLRDLEPGGMSLRAAYEEVHGAGAFDKAQEEIARTVESISNEMIEYRTDLSSK